MENENNSTTKKKEICRLCLTHDGLMRSIFDSEVTEQSENCLPYRITSCVSIKVSTSDQLPNKICHRCLFKVDMFFEFKIMCLNSDKTLKDSISYSSSDDLSENVLESTDGSDNAFIDRLDMIRRVNDSRVNEKETAAIAEVDGSCNTVLVNDGLTAVVAEAEHYLDSSEGIAMAEAAEELKCEVSVTNFEVNENLQLMDIKDENSDDVGSDDSEQNQGNNHHISEEPPRLNEPPYSCQECWKPSHSSSLVHHECPHTNERPFACDLCPLAFERSSQLVRHRASKHMQDESSEFRCPVCGRSFSDAYSQSRHMRTHSGTRPFSCIFCPRAFSRHQTLVAHITTNHQEQQQLLPLDVSSRGGNPVNNCGVVSNSSNTENKKRRNFTCELCSKTFSDSYTLQRHGRTHTGERPYPCSICGKTFSRSWSLARHVLLHTGERPHCCPLCGKRFADRSHLLRHVRTHGRAAAAAESALRAK